MVHLTNDAVQKKGEEYGKFENANKVLFYDGLNVESSKVSYPEFQKYLDMTMPEAKVNFMSDIYPQMRNLARDSVRAVYGKIDPNRREHSFEVRKHMGLDCYNDLS